VTFFGNSPTGQTRRQIFMHDGSNDADSRKDVLLYTLLTATDRKLKKNHKRQC